MADINAQSVEDYADRIVYRYAGGRYEQVLTNWAGSLSPGLKTLVNTDTKRSYIVPRSGSPAKFFKVEIFIFSCLKIASPSYYLTPYGLMQCGFFRVSIPSLNFDGKSQVTEFYKESTEQIVPSSQLRSINIGDILLEPSVIFANIQSNDTGTFSFSGGAGTTGLISIVQPIVTYYKK